jgi:hypothetical protein
MTIDRDKSEEPVMCSKSIISDNTTTTNSSKISNDDFSFKYTESGGLTAHYLIISFDSKTNTLTSSTDIGGSNLSQSISDSDKQELKDTIAKNNFLESKTDYPPKKRK